MEQCPNCGSEIIKSSVVIKTEDNIRVCSEWCKDEWNLELNEIIRGGNSE